MFRKYKFKTGVRAAIFGSAALFACSGVTSAGGSPTLGGAIAAKAIASACPNLMSDSEVADLDSYIVKRRAEITAINADDAISFNSFAPALEAEYARSDRCTEEGEDMAKDMLERVQDWLKYDD